MTTARTSPPPRGSTSSSVTAFHNLFDRVKPTWEIDRYGRTPKLEGPFLPLKLGPIITSFIDSNEPKDWTRLVHPEGALYWVYEYQRKQGETVMRVYTDAYLCDEMVRTEVEAYRDVLLDKTAEAKERMPDKWELVLDLRDDEHSPGRVCHYYFINCSNRTLFWLHEFDVEPLLSGLSEVKSMRRIQQAMEGFYWDHWEMFPHDRKVSDDDLKELIGIMIHAGIDGMTSQGSTSGYSNDELEQFISYVERFEHFGGSNGYSACVVGRLMSLFSKQRYINFFGQREARLSNDQSILGLDHDKKQRTWLNTTVSALLLFTQEPHLDALSTMYTDRVVCQPKWSKFIHRMEGEWRELVRIGTILLTANVAFLAIPSVDTSLGSGSNPISGIGAGKYPRNPVQVCSYVSIAFSMGCMITGQLLLRHHMTRPRDSAAEVDKYLRGYLNEDRGLETLAILYSLPQAFLLWAIASFFVAFVFVALVDSQGNWERYFPVSVTAICVALLVWYFWSTRVGRTEPNQNQATHQDDPATPFQSNPV